MAVVKILKSSKSFAAVGYNDERCKKGEAVLVKSVNFSLSSSFISAVDYLKIWGDNNKRIKNRQFHAIISLEKDEISKDELIDLGERWLREMGYGDNPYLIYYHTNTEHPHIHLVTSRVDKNGMKISDKFEKERAVQNLRKVENKSYLQPNRQTLANLLRYSFSTKYQFIELCKSAGFEVHIDDKFVSVRRKGAVTVLSTDLLNFCSQRYRRDVDAREKKRIQSLIYKYALKYSKENFIPYMHKKFGLEFVFYGKQDDINGYTIIDHKNKCVYKGSEIFGAKKISELLDVPQKSSNVELLIQDIVDDNVLCDTETLNKLLQKDYFYSINEKYQIIDKFDKTVVCKLKSHVIDKLEYNKRVRYYAEKFKPYNTELASIIARFAKVRVSDMNKLLTFPKPDEEKISFFNDLMSEAFASEQGVESFFTENHLALIISKSNYFIVDPITGSTISGSELNVSHEELMEKIKSQRELEQDDENTLHYEYDDIHSFILNPPMFDFAGLFFTGHVSGANTDKRKKRKL